MRVAITTFPFSFSHQGPDVFLSRLTSSFRKQRLCSLRSHLLPNYDVGLFAITNKSLYSKPYVLRVDGLYFDKNNTIGDSDLLNQQIFSGIKKAIGIVYVSEFSKIMVESFYGQPYVPHTIIHNKVPLNIFSPNGNNLRSQLGIGSNERILVTSAHWRRHKRLEETLELVSLLNSQSRHRYRLLVLGKKPQSQPNVPNVIFGGEIQPRDLAQWYRTGDIYLHLAWIEPCGNTQLEAMACGLPVICSNNGGIGETIQSTSGGIVANIDAKYNFNKIDYYSPPVPCYKALIDHTEQMFSNLVSYRNRIKRSNLDIDVAALKYTQFISKVLTSFYNDTSSK